MTNELEMLNARVTNWMLATGIRLSERDNAGPVVAHSPLRTIVLVIGRAPQAQSLDALLVATSDYDVIFVESIANSYSCINRVVPDVVIISSEVDEVATCQLLSMLKADRRSSGVPVLTCPTLREQYDLDYDLAELDQDASTEQIAAPLN